MAFLITDGKQTQITRPGEPSAEEVSNAIYSRGIAVNVLGIGIVDLIALWDYASDDDDLRIVDDFPQLDNLVKEISEILCRIRCKFG